MLLLLFGEEEEERRTGGRGRGEGRGGAPEGETLVPSLYRVREVDSYEDEETDGDEEGDGEGVIQLKSEIRFPLALLHLHAIVQLSRGLVRDLCHSERLSQNIVFPPRQVAKPTCTLPCPHRTTLCPP